MWLDSFDRVVMKMSRWVRSGTALAVMMVLVAALAALVTILLGLIIVSHWPLDSVYVLGTLLGVDLLFHGVGWVSFGMGLQSHR